MAEKDFAQVETSQFPAEPRSELNLQKPIILTLLATLAVMFCFGTGFYIGEQYGVEASKSNKHATLVTKLNAQQQELKALKEEAKTWHQREVHTSQVGELTFYNALPKQSIIPEPIQTKDSAQKSTQTPAASFHRQKKLQIDNEKDDIQAVAKKLEDIIQHELSTSARSFRVQIASFKTRGDAETFLPKLQGIGIPSRIQRVNLPNIGVWYRVYSASFGKEQQAMRAKITLKEKLNITGIMIQDD